MSLHDRKNALPKSTINASKHVGLEELLDKNEKPKNKGNYFRSSGAGIHLPIRHEERKIKEDETKLKEIKIEESPEIPIEGHVLFPVIQNEESGSPPRSPYFGDIQTFQGFSHLRKSGKKNAIVEFEEEKMDHSKGAKEYASEIEMWQDQVDKENEKGRRKQVKQQKRIEDFEKWKSRLNLGLEQSLELFESEYFGDLSVEDEIKYASSPLIIPEEGKKNGDKMGFFSLEAIRFHEQASEWEKSMGVEMDNQIEQLYNECEEMKKNLPHRLKDLKKGLEDKRSIKLIVTSPLIGSPLPLNYSPLRRKKSEPKSVEPFLKGEEPSSFTQRLTRSLNPFRSSQSNTPMENIPGPLLMTEVLSDQSNIPSDLERDSLRSSSEKPNNYSEEFTDEVSEEESDESFYSASSGEEAGSRRSLRLSSNSVLNQLNSNKI